jgi:probable HAF family extracellular repeat protein
MTNFSQPIPFDLYAARAFCLIHDHPLFWPSLSIRRSAMKNVTLLCLAILGLVGHLLAGPYKAHPLQGTVVNMNASEQVVGVIANQAYLWTRAGGYQMLGTLGGGMSFPKAINDSGTVVGSSSLPNGVIHAFVWTQSGGMQDLGSPLGGDSGALEVNAVGEVAGFSQSPDSNTQHAFYWSKATGIVDIGTLHGFSLSRPSGLNNHGEIAGNSSVAFRWTLSGGIQELPSLGGGFTNASAINDAGQIVGWSLNADFIVHAVLWAPDGSIRDLGTLPHDSHSSALFINAAGNITGRSEHDLPDGAQFFTTFFWTPAGGMFDIGAGTGHSDTPEGLNNRDQIIGKGHAPDCLNVCLYIWSSSAGLHKVASAGVVLRGQFNDAGEFVATSKAGSFLYSPVMQVSLNSSQNPSQSGQTVTFTASVGAIVGPPPDGENIKFYDGSKLMGSGTLSKGIATFSTSSLTVGTHNITAKYIGDTNYFPSKSPALQQVVNP